MDNCPRCHQPMTKHPALSRRDGSTEICAICGYSEAMIDMCMADGNLSSIPLQQIKFEYDFVINLLLVAVAKIKEINDNLQRS